MGIVHHSTPKKSRVAGTVDFLRHNGLLGTSRLKTRGRKRKLDHEALTQIERYIDKGGFDGHTLP
jgi:hypothetical protein